MRRQLQRVPFAGDRFPSCMLAQTSGLLVGIPRLSGGRPKNSRKACATGHVLVSTARIRCLCAWLSKCWLRSLYLVLQKLHILQGLGVCVLTSRCFSAWACLRLSTLLMKSSVVSPGILMSIIISCGSYQRPGSSPIWHQTLPCPVGSLLGGPCELGLAVLGSWSSVEDFLTCWPQLTIGDSTSPDPAGEDALESRAEVSCMSFARLVPGLKLLGCWPGLQDAAA